MSPRAAGPDRRQHPGAAVLLAGHGDEHRLPGQLRLGSRDRAQRRQAGDHAALHVAGAAPVQQPVVRSRGRTAAMSTGARSPAPTTSMWPAISTRRPAARRRSSRPTTTAARVAGDLDAGEVGVAGQFEPGRRRRARRRGRRSPSAAPTSVCTSPSSPVTLGIAHERRQVVGDAIAIDVRHHGQFGRGQVLHPRRIGRVMQVGPPQPLTHDLARGEGVHLAAGVEQRALGAPDCPRPSRPRPGRTASTLQPSVSELLLGHRHHADRVLLQQLVAGRRGAAAGTRPRGRRRPARSPTAGAGTRPARSRTARRTPARRRSTELAELCSLRRCSCAASGRCRRCRGRSQKVSPPSAVAGASSRPAMGMPWSCAHASTAASSPRRVGLPERSGITPAVGDQDRIEGVDQVGAADVSAPSSWTLRPRSVRMLAQRVVLALRRVEVDRVQVAVARDRRRPGRTPRRGGSRAPRGAARSCSGRQGERVLHGETSRTKPSRLTTDPMSEEHDYREQYNEAIRRAIAGQVGVYPDFDRHRQETVWRRALARPPGAAAVLPAAGHLGRAGWRPCRR